MHHPKLFGALILSLLPAYNVYLIGAGIPSVDPVHLGFLAFFVFAIAIYAALTIREGARANCGRCGPRASGFIRNHAKQCHRSSRSIKRDRFPVRVLSFKAMLAS